MLNQKLAWMAWICDHMHMKNIICNTFTCQTATEFGTWINTYPLQWRHNERDSVSNHQPHDCLLNRLFRRRSKKTSKLRVTGLCAGNSPGTGEFPAQMASSAENVSISWRHRVPRQCTSELDVHSSTLWYQIYCVGDKEPSCPEKLLLRHLLKSPVKKTLISRYWDFCEISR